MTRIPRTVPAIVLALLLSVPLAVTAIEITGTVVGPDGEPVVGARVTAERGDPARGTTVFSNADGHFVVPALDPGTWELRVRRIGWRDLSREVHVPGPGLSLTLQPEGDPEALAAQLPANRWFGLFLEQIDDPGHREQFVRQCTYCHQQGSPATRVPREDWQWEKVLHLMARMGGGLSPEVRAQVPGWFNAAYDPAHAVPRLTAGMGEADFAPPPPAEVRRAVIDEWVLGGRASMQHDLMVHPSGHVYSVDMMQDELFRLDPETGETQRFPISDSGLPLGGAFATSGPPLQPNANARVGPHSLQAAPDGSVWVTLALGNQLARFDPSTEEWSIYPMSEGFYPHTLRIDDAGRVWFTIAGSNHVARFDPETESFETIRLPAANWRQAVILRLLPLFLWIAQNVEIDPEVAGEGAASMPVPYGIDIAPNGDIWFSQLNAHKIGRIDPESFEVELVETPFSAPRRLRFDSKGRLWIPGFSSGVVSRFDPETRAFETWDVPIEPLGSETPYALHVDHSTDTVWICGTNSDSLIRFEPESEEFLVYPLPTRVTYTREIDFDAEGRVWTSNSNAPTWQIERGQPRVIRLDPRTRVRELAATP
ncbi:MAG: carboxypeptidase regulatory-like domain-containing protein [Myxococcales bacterium]|nr:carboxypeptidase regulatory-like domain-containing protein [Myxococcales bacterium]